MNMKEDLIMIIRAIKKRPVESLLLILGISLGIGATASGISIVSQTTRKSNALLNQTRFREIEVAARESSNKMEQPAEPADTGDPIILTANDLVARDDVQAVEYAYVANRVRLRFGNFSFGGMGENVVRRNGDNRDQNESPEGDPPPPPAEAEGRADGPGSFFNPGQEADLPEGPQPTVEELDGFQVSDEYFPAYGLVASQGSLFTLEDILKGEPYLILGSGIAQTLFEDGISLDRQVLYRRQLYTITGILEPTGTDLDMSGFIPTILPDSGNSDPRMRFTNWGTNLRFTVRDAGNLVVAKAQLSSWFDQTYGTGRVAISIPREQAEELADRNSRLVTIILILAVAGLLIASVNVSNILYSRAIRKRKAIGILKALGATRKNVFVLFFTEAVIIGLFGALFGSGLAVLLSGLMQTSLGIGGYSLGILGLGVLLSLATTLFLTNIPAMQTSKIPPSEAIRYE